MDTHGLETLLAVTLVAALAPMIVAALPGPRIPQVVILILAGILLGPHALGLADTGSIKLLANVGLGFLFLLAGYELDPRLLREHPGKLAIGGWAISAVIAVAAVAALVSAGYVRDFVPIGLALTTTALGTLLPILHDNDMLSGTFGRYVLAAGAVGELFPIVAISLLLTHRREFIAIARLARVRSIPVAVTAQVDDHRRHCQQPDRQQHPPGHRSLRSRPPRGQRQRTSRWGSSPAAAIGRFSRHAQRQYSSHPHSSRGHACWQQVPQHASCVAPGGLRRSMPDHAAVAHRHPARQAFPGFGDLRSPVDRRDCARGRGGSGGHVLVRRAGQACRG